MKPIWKGWISFGLIHIPINLYSGIREKELSFHLLHKKDLSPIRYARICKKDGKEVPWDEVVKGYTLETGDIVILTEEDFQTANLKRVKTISILDFSSEAEIPASYFAKPYLLEPQKGAAKAYALLCKALDKSKKVGICKFVLRNREHLGAIKAQNGLLILNQLRFPSELIQNPPFETPKPHLPKKELEMALKLIDQLTVPFNPKHYKDEYRKEILATIKQKAKGKRSRSKTKSPRKTPTTDFLKALQKSIKQSAA